MTREHDIIDVRFGDVDAAVRCKLRGVHHDPCAEFVGQGGELDDGEDFTGDVRGAGDRQQAHAALGEFAAEFVQASGKCRGGDDASVGHTLPGQQVGVVFDVQVQDLARCLAINHGKASGQQVQESVVFLVKITESSARPPTNSRTMFREFS